MIGDTVIILPIHRKKAKLIIPYIVNLVEQQKKNDEKIKVVVAIAGSSGTGKTEVATIIQQMLWQKYQIRAKQIHIDDFYKTHWQERYKVRLQKGIKSVGHKEINFTKLNRIIKNFKIGHCKLYTQRIHRWTNSLEHVIANANCIDVLLVEGIYALYLKQFDIGIYLEGTPEQTLKFRKRRKKENEDDPFRKEIVKKETQEAVASKTRAHLIVTWEGEIIK